jgi:hypothetical protein
MPSTRARRPDTIAFVSGVGCHVVAPLSFVARRFGSNSSNNNNSGSSIGGRRIREDQNEEEEK